MNTTRMLLILVLAWAISLPSGAAEPPADQASGEENTDQSADLYHLQAGDVLNISVWKEPDLARQARIRPDGRFDFPLAGEVLAEGRTVQEVKQELTERLEKYIPDPLVLLSVLQTDGYRIYVIGQVQRPGEFTVMRNVDVVQALSMAGGMTPFAAVNKIKILRRENGTLTAIPFRYGDIEKGKRLEQNIVLKGGDVVVVP